MASKFDPSRFIQAEQARSSQPIAACASDATWPLEAPKQAKNRDISTVPTAPLAGIAGLAGGDPQTLPWSDDLRRLAEHPSVPKVKFWNDVVEEAWDVSRQWGAQAIDLGWSSLDLFGCNPDPFARRVDRDGLVLVITGLLTKVKLVDLTAQFAVLHDRRGSVMKYRPPVGVGSVHIWEAHAMTTGP